MRKKEGPCRARSGSAGRAVIVQLLERRVLLSALPSATPDVVARRSEVPSPSADAGTVRGVIYQDVDGNGRRSRRERGAAGVFVFLDDDVSGVQEAGEPGASTTAKGGYEFDGVPAGSHFVRVVVPEGLVVFGHEPIRSAPVTPAGATKIVEPFGITRAGALSGRVIYDTNLIQSPEGSRLRGVGGYRLFLDANGDGVRQRSERALTTSGTGRFEFAGLAPGSYEVRVARRKGWLAWSEFRDSEVVAGVNQALQFRVFRRGDIR
jgi:hypothetical protein